MKTHRIKIYFSKHIWDVYINERDYFRLSAQLPRGKERLTVYTIGTGSFATTILLINWDCVECIDFRADENSKDIEV